MSAHRDLDKFLGQWRQLSQAEGAAIESAAWSDVGSIQAAELATAPFVVYPKRSNMRTMIEEFWKQIGIAPRVVMEADDTEALEKLVETGFGYSILPEFALRGRPRFFQTYRVHNIPAIFVIDKRGVIREVSLGYDPSEQLHIERVVQQLLAEPAPTP
jgi:DNA-binding transcriptional LysR family regulator